MPNPSIVDDSPFYVIGQYKGADKTWQPLVKFDVPRDVLAHAQQVTLETNNPIGTSYQLKIDGYVSRSTLRSQGTHLAFHFKAISRETILVQVRSTDGSHISVQGALVGVATRIPLACSTPTSRPKKPKPEVKIRSLGEIFEELKKAAPESGEQRSV